MNKNQKEDFKKAVEALQARAKELEEAGVLGDFDKLLKGMVVKGVASLIEDYLWGM